MVKNFIFGSISEKRYFLQGHVGIKGVVAPPSPWDSRIIRNPSEQRGPNRPTTIPMQLFYYWAPALLLSCITLHCLCLQPKITFCLSVDKNPTRLRSISSRPSCAHPILQYVLKIQIIHYSLHLSPSSPYPFTTSPLLSRSAL